MPIMAANHDIYEKEHTPGVITFILFSLPLLGVVSCTPRHEGTQGAAIAYPEPSPDSVAIPFLPGVVSKDSLDFNAAFSAEPKPVTPRPTPRSAPC